MSNNISRLSNLIKYLAIGFLLLLLLLISVLLGFMYLFICVIDLFLISIFSLLLKKSTRLDLLI